MNYSKPEVKTLGQAKAAIERVGKVTLQVIDPSFKVQQPAYDLDE